MNDSTTTYEFVDTTTDFDDAMRQVCSLEGIGYCPVLMTLEVASPTGPTELYVLALETE